MFPATILAGKRGLVAQSLAAREAKTVVNGDGCGFGWYGEVSEPGLYRNIRPAWSDPNLVSLCRQIRTSMFCAHIRSATSGEVSIANCHPFASRRHLFMHNGQIGGYDRVRRRIEGLIGDEYYTQRRGTADSESIFLAALGRGLDETPVEAMTRTLGEVIGHMREAGITAPLRFAAIHANGERLWAYRWSSDAAPPTLYWRHVETGTLVASEPLDDEPWTEIPPNTVVTADGRGELTSERLEVAV